ncbi:insulinase family protein [Paenibacillus pasadenensis]|uniref:EF-P 5-aminopentanol modification-associated protein YfmH n=1 Tax=Paenibacillus pasadenensis TaxID=217090 RepID=UPI00203AA921|nr:pitrilysin family protein [Paenibacillus pasadenensis]MCM3745946.1 insulinase family protein [Paenibacillus pasadenensis]
MEKLNYPGVEETLYFEKLPNGLSVYLLPKEGFQKTYATFSTCYGSIDNHFRVGSEPLTQVPDGIAHFLEHKMFEEPTGDIFATFASQGASANAFTSFDRTVYLFSATEQIEANLSTLIDFVQHPYFTDQNVDKEKGIIAQEINMYSDNPDWRVYYGLIEALYQVHPVHIDIAGTVESIYKINKEMLYRCYETFYHPSNMLLFVVGGIDAETIMELIRSNQAAKSFPDIGKIERYFEAEPAAVRTPLKSIQLQVSQPKCLFGFKEKSNGLDNEALLRRDVTTKLMLETLLGSSSPLYQSLYDDNLISDSFGYEYTCSKDYGFSIIGGDTQNPEELVNRIKEHIGGVLNTGLDAAAFDRIKKKRIGSYLRMLNSPESIASEFTRYKFRGQDLFELLPAYESITLEEANARLREHFDFGQLAISVVNPTAKQEAPAS